MKKTVLTLFIWNAFHVSFAQQLPNSDFSLWSSSNGVKVPSSWTETSNRMLSDYNDPKIPLTVTEVTGVDAFGGQGSSVLLETKTAAGAIVNQGYKAINAYIYRKDNLTNSNVESITFNYKADIISGDNALVNVVLRDNAQTGIVEQAFFITSSNNSTTWNTKTISLTKNPGVTTKPVSIEISVYSTASGSNQMMQNPKIGSKLYLDNFILKYAATAGVDEVASSNMKIYPNPTKDNISINANSELLKMELVSMDGRVLIINEYKESIDISDFSEGAYYLNVYYPDGQKSTHKILKI